MTLKLLSGINHNGGVDVYHYIQVKSFFEFNFVMECRLFGLENR